jgi:hypothetical protein
MMPHPLVSQLRFTRSEFMRAVKVSATRMPASALPADELYQLEHRSSGLARTAILLLYGQGQMLLPDINEQLYGRRQHAPLKEMLAAWKLITAAVDPWLDTLTTARLKEHVIKNGKPTTRIFGNLLQRVIYHYWYHTGENMAIRQGLGHSHLPEFVGNIDGKAPYRPEIAEIRA